MIFVYKKDSNPSSFSRSREVENYYFTKQTFDNISNITIFGNAETIPNFLLDLHNI